MVRKAHVEAEPSRQRHNRKGFFGGLLAGVAVVALVLTPAGAQVSRWVGDVVDPPGIERAEGSLGELPGGGRLLVQAGSGTWLVEGDGTKQRVGDYESATWSPRGLYVAATDGDGSLLAVDVHDEVGDERWSLDVGARVHDQSWAPSGQRIAYRAGRELRMVAGDGTGDRSLVAEIAPVVPAWEPEDEYTGEIDQDYPRHRLAYVGAGGRTIHVIRADTDSEAWSAKIPTDVRALAWTDRGRLAVVGQGGLRLFSRGGTPEESFGFGGRQVQGLSAGTRERIAVRQFRRQASKSRVSVTETSLNREVFSGPRRFSGATFSPGGDRILIEWPAADQWLFVSPDGQRVDAVSGIGEEFRSDGPRQFPRVSGWCCR
ncbi:hypothetical protein HJD18_03525 [Thermoleophilia bacterium SCSIO 60948]|nr:hypothetical protein HJD18_03525 [Thermoleophilia bacterium SCSIO 60948]